MASYIHKDPAGADFWENCGLGDHGHAKHACICGGRCAKVGIIVESMDDETAKALMAWMEMIQKEGDFWLNGFGFKFCLKKIYVSPEMAYMCQYQWRVSEEFEVVANQNGVIGEKNLDLIIIFSAGGRICFIKKMKIGAAGEFETVSECMSYREFPGFEIFRNGKEIMINRGKLVVE